MPPQSTQVMVAGTSMPRPYRVAGTVPPVDRVDRIRERKREHLELALTEASQSRRASGWDDVALVPSALPERSLGDIDLSAELVGHRLRAPLLIVGMTGGHPDARMINKVLGAVAEAHGIAVGVGSQRAALEVPELAPTFASVRDHARTVPVLANIGALQLIAQGERPALGAEKVARLVDMVRADAIAVHLNVVQELLQPEGDRVTGPLLPALAALVRVAPVPVIVKETGAGIDRESARRLVDAGAAALDVGGVGGTSFARIETERAGVGEGPFADWGIPAAASVLECRGLGVPVIATGGIADGATAAKPLALGASLVGIGRAALLAANDGVEAAILTVGRLIDELRTAVLLSGGARPSDLMARPPVLTGATEAWARQRGLLA